MALLAAPVAGVAANASPAGNGGGGDHWVAAWATAPHGPHPFGAAIPGTSCPQQATGATNETVRNVVYTHAGGNRVRVRVSNVYGTAPLEIGAASVARSAGADQTVPGTLRQLTFRGSQQVSIPAGTSTLSDPVKLTVAPLSTLALSVYVSGTSTSVTGHLLGKLSYAAPGNHATAPTLPAAQPLTCWLFTTGIDVRAQGRVQGTVVALGDSITDGLGSDFSENESYPDYLARRLDARRGPTLSVANAGISANRLLSSPLPITGEPAIARFDRDVLAQSGATDVILLEGVNDIDNGETARGDHRRPDRRSSSAPVRPAFGSTGPR